MIISKWRVAPIAAALGLLALQAPSAQAQTFKITNLTSDGSVAAAVVDTDLVNPWGISYSPGGAFWVSDNGTGLSTLYDFTGAKVPLVLTIPTASGTGVGAPTGQVYNATDGAFLVTKGDQTGVASFLFATEDGTISGWASSVDATNAIIAVNNAAQGAVYKGLAIAINKKKGPLLYAANFNAGDVEMYDSKFHLVKAFTDPTLPAGYAPHNVQVLDKTLYVTFAKQNAAKDASVSGAGLGYVDAFTLGGAFLRRVASNGALNAPWGLDIAPAKFGKFAGALLVGNFGDGWVNAYDPGTGAYIGPLTVAGGAPIVIQDLWGLINGNGGLGGSKNTVYFTAGLKKEAHGLFGGISVNP